MVPALYYPAAGQHAARPAFETTLVIKRHLAILLRVQPRRTRHNEPVDIPLHIIILVYLYVRIIFIRIKRI
jgi:hypothetical protein